MFNLYKIVIYLILCHISLSFETTFYAYCGYKAGEFYTEFTTDDWPDNDGNTFAFGIFNDSQLSSGSGSLNIWIDEQLATSYDVNDHDRQYCAGMLEGYLTAKSIEDHFKLFWFSDITRENYTAEQLENLEQYMQQNYDYVHRAAKAHSDQWWQTVNLILARFDGIVDGYRYSNLSQTPISKLKFWYLNSAGELDDLGIVIGRNIWPPKMGRTMDFDITAKDIAWHDTHHHCSALIALASNYSDVYFSQDTWSSYLKLHRIMKTLIIPLESVTGSSSWSYSSVPGVMVSPDDFWILDSGLLVLETTFNNFNYSLYADYCAPESVFTWIRVQVAHMIAENGYEWTKNFIIENSGTYNNQYQVLDLKLFKTGSVPSQGFLYVIEQAPGHYVTLDRTTELITNGYIPSFNTPYTKELFELMGYPQMIEKTGCGYWSYWNNSRMKILERDFEGISSYDDFQNFMRYNKWRTDPLSNGDSAESILSRYDLRPEECIHIANMTMCPNAFGGLDSKTTSYIKAYYSMYFDVIVSPQYEDNIPWQFGKPPYEHLPFDGLTSEPWTYLWRVFYPQKKSPVSSDYIPSYDLCYKKHVDDCNRCTNDINCGIIPSIGCHYGDEQGPLYPDKIEFPVENWIYTSSQCPKNPKSHSSVFIIIGSIIAGGAVLSGLFYVYYRRKKSEDTSGYRSI